VRAASWIYHGIVRAAPLLPQLAAITSPNRILRRYRKSQIAT